MGLEVITDDLIAYLLKTLKQVENPHARLKKRDGHMRLNYQLTDAESNRYQLYLRQNTRPGMEDDFSCGLAYILLSGGLFTLTRYNGPSHIHKNKLENEKLEFVPHIHTATRKYLDLTGKGDGYAEKSDKYVTLNGALYCLIKDCNISGIEAKPDQPELF